jgi:hypothetical protein
VATTYRCSFCGSTIDVGSKESMIVTVHRLVDENEWDDDDYVTGAKDTFRFCSQAHLAEHARTVPLPPPQVEEDDQMTWGERVGCAASLLVLLALVLGAFYGFASMVERVVG